VLGHSERVTRQLSPTDDALDRLIAEFRDHLPIGGIIKTFARAVRGLQMAGVEAGLIVAAEAMARNQLASRVSARALVK
jgi:hypothetical protein